MSARPPESIQAMNIAGITAQDQYPTARRGALLWACGAVALLALSLALPDTHALQDSPLYLPLHLGLEGLSIVVGVMIFALTWETSHHRQDTDLLLGSGFLAVALLDFVHALSYQGMPALITPASPEKAINFWLLARLLAALILLLVALRPWSGQLHRRMQRLVLAGLLGGVVLACWIGLWHPDRLPRTFIPGSGLTPFKIASEYFIIVLGVAATALLWQRGRRERSPRLVWLAAATWLMALAEMYFTFYGNVTDLFNLSGHLYKVVAYGLVYRALVVSLLLEPYQQMEQQHALLGSLHNAMPELIWMKTPDGVFRASNPAFEAFWGIHGEVVGHTSETFVDPAVARVHAHRDREAMAATAPIVYEAWLENAHRERRLLEIIKTAIRQPDGRVGGVLGIARDITARRRGEERLRLAARVFEHTHEGIIITDPRGVMVDTNPAVSRISGYRRDELLGKTPAIFKSGHQGDAFYAALWQTLETQGFWRGEVWNRKKNGELYVELLTISAVHDPEGRLTHYVGVFSDITQLREQQARLEQMVHYDPLTRLPNRVLLGDRLQQAMARTRRDTTLLAVCYVDLDGFKPVNDRLGHQCGDRLLVQVAERLLGVLRGGDTVARLGGDEFVVLLSLADQEEVHQALGRLLETLARPYQLGECGHPAEVSASVGVTLYPLDRADPDTLLRHADQAMYQAKLAGRNRYQIFDPESLRQTQRQQQALARIRQALEDEELVLHYQPKVDLRLGRVVGAEALIRWQHPERGLVMPGEFLPLVENSSLAAPLGDWVLATALAQTAAWWQAGLTLTVSVNIAAPHLLQADFVERLCTLLGRYPALPPSALELEILESTALEDMDQVDRLIRACRQLGVSVALDDFGTGYSSLTYLKRLSADVLKIDRSFVLGMLADADDLTIVQAVIGLGQAFRKRIVAEGVETVEHGLKLLQMGCELAQGYGIARPMAAGAFTDWFRDYRPQPRWMAVAARLDGEPARVMAYNSIWLQAYPLHRLEDEVAGGGGLTGQSTAKISTTQPPSGL